MSSSSPLEQKLNDFLDESIDEEVEAALLSLELHYSDILQNEGTKNQNVSFSEGDQMNDSENALEDLLKPFGLYSRLWTEDYSYDGINSTSVSKLWMKEKPDMCLAKYENAFLVQSSQPSDLLSRVNQSYLADAITCLVLHHAQHYFQFSAKIFKRVSWLKSSSQLFHTLAQNISEIDQNIVDIQSRCLEVFKKTQTAHIPYNQVAEQMNQIQAYSDILRQKISYFDLQNNLKKSIGENIEQFVIKLLTEHLNVRNKAVSTDTGADHHNEADVASLDNVFIQLEDGLQYFQFHSDFRHSSSYISGLKNLRSQLLLACRRVFCELLESCENPKVRPEPIATYSGLSFLFKTRERALPNPFCCKASYKRLICTGKYAKPLIDVLRKRANRTLEPVYTESLTILEGLYAASRLRVAENVMQNKLKEIQEKMHQGNNSLPSTLNDERDAFIIEASPLSRIIQQTIDFFVSVGRLEIEGFLSFFSSFTQGNNEGFRNVLSVFSDLLVQAFRPFILRTTLLKELRTISDVLKCEFLFSNAQLDPWTALKQEGLEPLVEGCRRLHFDVEERLTFKTEIFIEYEIKNYQPQNDDLNYPDLLFKNRKEIPYSLLTVPSDVIKTPNDDTSCIKALPYERIQKKSSEKTKLLLLTDGPCYPPLSNFLLYCNSTLTVLKSTTSHALWTNAVRCCISALQNGAARLKHASEDDAYLFLIRHLLKLRDIISGLSYTVEFHQMHLSANHSFNAMIHGKNITTQSDNGTREKSPFSTDLLSESHRNVKESYQSSSLDFFETTLITASEALIGYYSSVFVLPLINLYYLCESNESSQSTPHNMKTFTNCKQQFCSRVELSLVEEHLRIFRAFLEAQTPKVILKLYAYLLPTCPAPHSVIELWLADFRLESPTKPSEQVFAPCGTTHQDIELFLNLKVKELFSSARTLAFMIRSSLVEKIKEITCKLMKCLYGIHEISQEDNSFTTSKTIFQDRDLWWTPEEIAQQWNTLCEEYENLILKQIESSKFLYKTSDSLTLIT